MYTQCPDCSIAFRVTAAVLKQAAGKVRCGGCGSAFNALDYLSESMPSQAPPKEADADAALPELKPEPDDSGAPKSISAAQSAALLKTLDELAGSDIRIEDTGVEWRVLDDDEIGEAADDERAGDDPVEDQPAIDELLEDSPTPVDQFLTDTPPQIDAPEIFSAEANEPATTPVDELRFDDNTPLPDDFDLDGQSEFTSSDVFRAPEDAEEPDDADPVADVEPQIEIDLSDPDGWSDILDEFEDLAGVIAEADSDDPETVIADSSGNEPLDVDTQFALQAEAMGIDISGISEAPVVEDPTGDLDVDTVEDPDAGAEPEDVDLDELLVQSQAGNLDLDELLQEELVDEDTADEPDAGKELDVAVDAAQLELIEQDEPAEADAFDDDDERPDEHYVPPMSEEEQTINMQIDQDLLAIAVPDEDGFASTIVIPEDGAEAVALKPEPEPDDEDAVDETFRDTGAGFETIIMEGEFIRTGLEQEKLAADAAAAASLAGAAAAEREAEEAARAGSRSHGMIAGLVALVLVLAVQVLHQSREALATIPAFNSVVGPVYRAIGQPLSPEWDITGWRFEVTRGSTDESNEVLTVYSRIGNQSDTPLPYPLIGISLTDRFEETIGSRVLDPADYLANDLDPRKLVEPGNTFNAVISIPSPAADATGFKLNVCYRESGGNLRCAIDDFK